MTRYMIAVAAAALLASQADAQIVISAGGFGNSPGYYQPYGGVINTSGYYHSGYYTEI